LISLSRKAWGRSSEHKNIRKDGCMEKYTFDTRLCGRQFEICGLHRGDSGFRNYEFSFISGSGAFSLPEGVIATLFAHLPSGETVYAPCTVRENKVIYSLSAGASDKATITSCAGRIDCELRITASDGSVLTSPGFSFVVEDILQCDDAVEQQSDFSALTEALSRVLLAETGLSSKQDLVIGEQGSLAAFDEDGKLCDSGVKPAQIFYLIFKDSHATSAQNIEALKSIISVYDRGGTFAVFIRYDNVCLPAEWIRSTSAKWTFTASYTDAGEILTMELNRTSETVEYSKQDITEVVAFDETSAIPASQEVIAKYVESRIPLIEKSVLSHFTDVSEVAM